MLNVMSMPALDHLLLILPVSSGPSSLLSSMLTFHFYFIELGRGWTKTSFEMRASISLVDLLSHLAIYTAACFESWISTLCFWCVTGYCRCGLSLYLKVMALMVQIEFLVLSNEEYLLQFSSKATMITTLTIRQPRGASLHLCSSMWHRLPVLLSASPGLQLHPQSITLFNLNKKVVFQQFSNNSLILMWVYHVYPVPAVHVLCWCHQNKVQLVRSSQKGSSWRLLLFCPSECLWDSWCRVLAWNYSCQI